MDTVATRRVEIPARKGRPMKGPLGIHVLYDLYRCQKEALDDPAELNRLLLEAVTEAQMTPLESASHKYTPQGVSVVVLVAESHISIHTWPEYDYAAADFFSCRTDVDPERVRAVLARTLNPERIEMQIIQRGTGVF